ncbi:MAG: hypothetical protein ACSLE6_02840 [Mycobacterium sp.]
MTELTPELRAEIVEILSASAIRHAMVFRDVQQGLTAQQMAASQHTSVSNVRNLMRSVQHLLVGTLPASASLTLVNATVYRELMTFYPSPELRAYAMDRLRELAANNPAVNQVHTRAAAKPRPATKVARPNKRAERPEKVCPHCFLVHAGECD